MDFFSLWICLACGVALTLMMADAADCITGYEGTVAFLDGHDAQFNRASFQNSQRIHRVTGFQDTDEQYKGGIQAGGGSIAGVLLNSDAPAMDVLEKDAAEIEFTYANSCTETFDAVISNVVAGIDQENLDNTVSFDFVRSGPVTESWSGSPP